MREYVFRVGDRDLIIEADSEQIAFHILIEKYWDLINEEENVELMGEIVEKYKVDEIPKDFEEEND